MTHDDDLDPTPVPDPEKVRARSDESWHHADGALQTYLQVLLGDFSDNPETGFDLSVLAGPALISGRVVSFTQWERKATAIFREALGVEDEPYRDPQDGIADFYAEHKIDTPAHEYIHFEDAVVNMGPAAFRHATWRVKLADVTGWAFATFNRED